MGNKYMSPLITLNGNSGENMPLIDWIREAVDFEGGKKGGLLKDVGTGEKVLFAGASPIKG